MPDRLVWAEIDLDAYRHNLRTIKTLLRPLTNIMAVVKANGYGHGAPELAQVAIEEGCTYLGVVCLYEAKQLRKANIQAPILILNYLDSQSFDEATSLELDITVMDRDSIMTLSQVAQSTNKKVNVHLKVDTGMRRAGCDPNQVLELAELIASQKNLVFKGIFTHFAAADDVDSTFTHQQLSAFQKVLAQLKNKDILPPLVHAANSAATLAFPSSHFTLVRPGIITYGLNPFPKNQPLTQLYSSFKPVLSLKTQVISVKRIDQGETVGYGRTFVAEKPMTIALIPVGYGDGFRRAPRTYGEVLIHGKRAPLIGRVSMDQSTIDVSHLPNVKIGDEVVLIGTQGKETISAENVAEKIETINYEVVTALSARVSRMYMSQ